MAGPLSFYKSSVNEYQEHVWPTRRYEVIAHESHFGFRDLVTTELGQIHGLSSD